MILMMCGLDLIYRKQGTKNKEINQLKQPQGFCRPWIYPFNQQTQYIVILPLARLFTHEIWLNREDNISRYKTIEKGQIIKKEIS